MLAIRRKRNQISGEELSQLCDLSKIGGIVTKAISLEPRTGNAPPVEPGQDMDDIAAAILGALEGEPNGLTITDIAAKIGKNKNNIRRPLNELVSGGQVIKISVNSTDPNTSYKLAKYA